MQIFCSFLLKAFFSFCLPKNLWKKLNWLNNLPSGCERLRVPSDPLARLHQLANLYQSNGTKLKVWLCSSESAVSLISLRSIKRLTVVNPFGPLCMRLSVCVWFIVYTQPTIQQIHKRKCHDEQLSVVCCTVLQLLFASSFGFGCSIILGCSSTIWSFSPPILFPKSTACLISLIFNLAIIHFMVEQAAVIRKDL